MEFKVLSHSMLHFMLLTLTIVLLLRLPTNHCCELNGITYEVLSVFFKETCSGGISLYL